MNILIFEHCLKVTEHRIPYAALAASAFDDCDVVLGLLKLIENHASVAPYLDSSFNVDFYDAKVCFGQQIQPVNFLNVSGADPI